MLAVVEVAASLGIANAIQPLADVLNAITPAPITKYSHGAAMAYFLLASGFYGSYLGWQIRTADGPSATEAKDKHPLMLRTMTAAFTFGAVGGLISLVMQVCVFKRASLRYKGYSGTSQYSR